MSKVHVGCGSVYLDGYINVDVRGPKTFLAHDRPDLVSALITTDDRYYGRHQDKTMEKLRSGPLQQEMVCDEYGTFFDLPGSTWSIEELLARHVFEHLSLTEAHQALDEIDRKMKEGGILRLDVPDHEETLRQFKKTGDEFFIRHLLGPRKDERGYHLMSYTRTLLQKIVESHGFVFIEEEQNIHFYPAFCLRFQKPYGRIPVEYAIPSGTTWKAGSRILDIGPGKYPLQIATHYLDVSQNHLNNAPAGEKINSDIQGKTPFPDKYFDYVFCSHVLEHLDDPEAALKEISRIGKCGVIAVPSAFKEFLFLDEEEDHKWWIFPAEKTGGPIRFMRKTKGWIKELYDEDVSKALCRLFRSGPNTIGPDQRLLRKWFYKKEPNLDVIVNWEGNVCLQYV